jgi:hypothetical protein
MSDVTYNMSMINADKVPLGTLAEVHRIVVHKGCPDGLAAAILLSDALATRPPPAHCAVDFIENETAEHLALVPEPGLLICDIAPHPSRGREFASREDVIILDHHKSVREIVEACPLGVYASEETGMSGASLAFACVWDRMHPDRLDAERRQLASDFADLAAIRDTFQRKHPRWTDACEQGEVLRFYNAPKYWIWNGAFRDKPWWTERMRLGAALRERRMRDVKRDIDTAQRFTSTAGTRVLVICGLGQATDVADAASDVDLVLGFMYMGHGQQMVITTRSADLTFNCQAFCKAYGGGGHVGAAGFRLPIRRKDPNPYVLLRRLLEQFESQTTKASQPPPTDAPESA